MLLTRLLWLSLSLVPVFSSPIASSEDAAEKLKKRTSTFAITGATGGLHQRYDIHKLMTYPTEWNLYLLTVLKFQQMDQSTMTSYYQIAGIHGVPNVPWDGVAANPASDGAVGYCPHGSILFPTWHRAYLGLFEQVFQTVAVEVANEFPAGTTRNNYLTAANNLRLPFWDWAAAPPSDLPTFPYVFSEPYITVTGPVNGMETIANPLFRFNFNPLVASDMLYNPWAIWPVTKRYPTNDDSYSASSQNNLAQSAIENNRLNIRDNVYNMFTLCSAYPEFSNDNSASSTAGCSTSLESIHDSIHSLVGGSNDGHMTWLWWAAFDPVFWLHHANVDRLFAMWQTIYPDSYTVNQVAQGSTFTIATGSTQGLNSPLTPFHKDTTGDFWTSAGVQGWTQFGYTYPEFVDSAGDAAAIKSYVNELYGPSATATAGSTKRTAMPEPVEKGSPIAENKPANVERETAPGATQAAAPVGLITTSNGSIYQYITNIHAHRFGLDGAFSVYVFLGNVSEEDATEWPFEPALIGSHGIISSPGMAKNTVSVSGAVPLTRALQAQVDAGVLADMDIANVVPYLRSNLQWRIATSNNTAVDPSEVPGLQVSVVTANSTVPTSADDFPTWSGWTTLQKITHGRAGGLSIIETVASDAARESVKEKLGEPVDERGTLAWGKKHASS